MTRIERNVNHVTIVVEIPYLRMRFAVPGNVFHIERLDCSHLEFTPYDGTSLFSPDEIVQAQGDIVEAQNEGDDVVVWGSRGVLRLRYRTLVLRFDDGSPLALAALDACARAYWEEWDRDVRQPAPDTTSSRDE